MGIIEEIRKKLTENMVTVNTVADGTYGFMQDRVNFEITD